MSWAQVASRDLISARHLDRLHAEIWFEGDEPRRAPAGRDRTWHLESSDEVWHFYEGSPLELLVYEPATGLLETARLGPLDEDGCVRNHVVPRGHWQAARSMGEFTLVGCSVAPGFSFEDFRFVADIPGHDAHFRGALQGTSSLL